MKFEPTEDRVLVKPIPPEKFVAGIELYGADIQPNHEGTVVHPGDGQKVSEVHLHVHADLNPESAKILMEGIDSMPKRHPPMYKAGDYVMYGRYAGTKIMYDGEEHLILRESDIFGVIR